VSEEGEASKMSWYVISYISPAITNKDLLMPEGDGKWHYSVYRELAEKGVIKLKDKPVQDRADQPEPAVKPAPAATEKPLVSDEDLPPPPRAE